MTANELRIVIAIIGALIFALIWLFGKPKRPKQGRRTPVLRDADGERIEPTFGESEIPLEGEQAELSIDFGPDEIERLGSAIAAKRNEPIPSIETPKPLRGVRPEQPIERIVTLFVSARAGETIHGSNLVVAAEKAGMTFGDMGIFHRLISGKPEVGPIFSMANMVKPGNFDMRHIDELRTPGVSFFMTLPGPLPALDAWDALLPTAQRLAELLEANVLDEERNALGRQRVAHLRDELRAWDRKQERSHIRLR
ncbi:MAG: cell division protein ZipA [Rudaea sp.]